MLYRVSLYRYLLLQSLTILSYMAMLVQSVVGELELEEGHRLFHPVAPRGRRVWVQVRPTRRLRLRLPSHFPFLFIPLEGDQELSKNINKVYLSYKEGEVIFRGSLPNFKEAKRESDSLACTTDREKGANSRG